MRKSPLLRKSIAVFLVIMSMAIAAVAAWLGFVATSLSAVDFLLDPAVSFRIPVLDWYGGIRSHTVGPDNPHWTPLGSVPDSLRQTVVAAEDFNFFHHRGVDWFEVWEAVKTDITERRFARGASTITQQLAKNLYLSRDRTLGRKARELILTGRLERTLSKERILELYLNVVELGPMVYGIGHAANHYFEKTPAELTLRENAFLVAMLPGPRVYDPFQKMDQVLDRSDRILGILLRAGRITDAQYLAALEEIPVLREMEIEQIQDLLIDRAAFFPPLPESENLGKSTPGIDPYPAPVTFREEIVVTAAQGGLEPVTAPEGDFPGNTPMEAVPVGR